MKRTPLAAASFGKTAYFFGGYTNAGAVGVIEAYDHETETVQVVGAMPARAGSAAATVLDKIYVFGGHGPEGLTNEILEFDPITNDLRVIGELSSARTLLSAAAFGPKVCVFGGQEETGFFEGAECFTRADFAG